MKFNLILIKKNKKKLKKLDLGKKLLFSMIIVFILTINIYAQEVVDMIVAKVGREIILVSELARHINQMRNAQMWDARMTEIEILESMVENKLIVQKARELNIAIDDRRITNMVDAQIAQVRASFSTEEEFFRELRAAGFVLSDLRQYYEDLIREQFLRERLIQSEIRSRIHITDAELLVFFDEEQENFPIRETSYELAVIMRIPSASSETDNEALEKINHIKRLLDIGEDFEDLAREYSDCPSGRYGGDLGYFSRGMMVEEFENVAFDLSLNQVSDIVKTDFGYHIIKHTGSRGNEVQASHILVMIRETEGDIEVERDLLLDLKARISNGEEFGYLAMMYSHDENSKENHGIIREFTQEEFPPWFANDLINLEIGEVSDVLIHQNILYLFTINQIIEPRPYEFSEVNEQLREILMQRKQYDLYEEWIEELKNEIYVEIYEDRLNVFRRG
ncbi:MAG: peptidylprolyl isomerase [Candidatus Cloacimonetes bacterium]|nr:peptidylprolyl isomerase [Candidatus Cloacimonadota bacterium]